MAVIDTTRTHGAPAGAIGQFFAKITSSFAAWNEARVTRNTLSRLTDRELDDIGLSRGDLAGFSRTK